MAEAVAELNPLDDRGQAVPAVEFAPFLLRRNHQLERHGLPGLAAKASFGAFRAMPDGGEGAFDRIWRLDVLPVFRRVVVEVGCCFEILCLITIPSRDWGVPC